MRKSFEYWYPMDLRCSGKDLIRNHLTMMLYNHYYIWGEKYLPKGVFCNGWVLVDGEKMSKSKGNFILLEDSNKDYSSDATRLTLASAGDSITNANFSTKEANNNVLKLSNLEKKIKELVVSMPSLRKESCKET